MLNEWLAFHNLEPWGGDTPYIGHAITASTIVNARPWNKKKVKPEDFVPKFRRKAQTLGEQMNIAAMLTVALGGTVGEDNG